MKVILTETIESLGIIGSEVTVADGYARNYLLPQNKAVPATPANRKVLEQQKAKQQEKRKNSTKSLGVAFFILLLIVAGVVGLVVFLGVVISWLSNFFAVRKYIRLKTDYLYY